MASNNELRDRVKVLSDQLHIFTPTAGLKNAELEQLVAKLEGEVAAAAPVLEEPAPPAGDTATPPAEQPPAGAPPPPPATAPAADPGPAPHIADFVVAPRHSITSARGVIGPGVRLREGDIPLDSALELYAHAALVKFAPAAAPAPASSEADGSAGPGGG